MLYPINFIRQIPIEIPVKMILMRLGYRNKTTEMSISQRDKVSSLIDDGFAYCNAAGCFRRIEIMDRNEDHIILEDGCVLKSKSLADLLHKSSAIVLMASTVGADIVRAASDAVARNDGATAVIYDAVGGQSADTSMTWINDFIRRQLGRTMEKLTSQRYSPGFGDLSLENQKIIYELLELEKLGLSLTLRYMLVPEKSVTAIAGIEKID